MQHRHCAEAVSRCLQFLRDDDRPFGCVIMVFAGDCAQTLPVVPRGSVANISNATLQSFVLWPQVVQLKLTENMRLRRDDITVHQLQRFDNSRIGCWRLEREGTMITMVMSKSLPPPYIRLISPDDGLPALTAATYGDVWRNELFRSER
jgi:hypothetical protein